MTPEQRKIQVLEIVAQGGTLSEAGKSVGVGAVRARDMLSSLCRAIRMSRSLNEIRLQPDEYIKRAKKLDCQFKMNVGRKLVNKLIKLLNLKDENNINPEYLSSYSASELARKGLSSHNIADLEHNMLRAGKTLK